jgi:hypothetical protein
MNSLSNEDLEKHLYILRITQQQIKEIIGTYAWHGNHLAHITELKKKKVGNY